MCPRVTLLGANNVMSFKCELCFCLFSAHFKMFGLMLKNVDYHLVQHLVKFYI